MSFDVWFSRSQRAINLHALILTTRHNTHSTIPPHTKHLCTLAMALCSIASLSVDCVYALTLHALSNLTSRANVPEIPNLNRAIMRSRRQVVFRRWIGVQGYDAVLVSA
ncbi:hypothetical protein P3342_001989 [Pyrenophora teres f. teres]|nr:hypothetical protein P3342_001989 [Pyrenophora teres f. teres]